MPRLVLGIALLVALAGAAHAQPAGNVPLDTFRPAMDSRGYITVNASQTLGDKEVSFGLGALDWGHDLLNLDANGKTYTIDNVIQATLSAAVGLRVGPADLELGASIPFAIMTGDRGPDAIAGANPNEHQAYKLDGQGLGNIALHVKTRFLKTSRGPHLGLGLVASVYLPTVTPTDRFLGEASGRFVPELVGILDKELGEQRRLRVSLNGGIRLRPRTTFTNRDPGELGAPVTDRRVTVGDEVPFGLGVAYAIAPQRFDVVGEVFGSLPLGDHLSYQPLEVIGGVKLYLARNSFLSLGGGRGLASGKGASPGTRAFIGIVFEPNLGDRDADGLKDDVDQCPDEPEDKDGFEDEDGCPDPDNDKDRIPDKDDRCPNEPETYNNVEDEDGCPDRGSVIRIESKLVPLEPINFEYNSAIITKDSYHILDAVVAALQGNPDISKIEIQGHTDERGDDAYNLDLSERRAASVLTYLMTHGVDARRMQSQGYGETQPVDRGHTQQAWAKNRRVEFLILDHRD